MSIIYSLHRSSINLAFQGIFGWQHYGRYASFLDQSQWWPYERIVEFQNQKLQDLIAHAYTKVPYYHAIMKSAGIECTDIRSAQDLKKLPILSKEIIQNNVEQLLTAGCKRNELRQNHTGGSTGQPITFYQDKNFSDWGNAELLRDYRMSGYELGTRWAFLWGSDVDAKAHKGWQGRLKDQIIYNTLWINTFDLSFETIASATDQLIRWRPEIIVAYVSSITMLARYALEKGIDLIRPRAIQTSAEVLTSADRDLIRRAFGCEAFDRYGCREVGNIAHECDAHKGIHELMETNLLEILDDNDLECAPGKIGRVVVTNLCNYAMPFIRYENGDLAIRGRDECPCGRGLPLIDQIAGRIADVITSPSGKLIHGEFFTHLFYKINGVQQFRVVQESLQELIIQVVPGYGFDAETVFSFLETAIHTHGDSAFQLRFEVHDHLPPASSGKYRFTSSKVPLTFSRIN